MMVARRHILSSLPMLAAALTGRDGISVRFTGDRAYTTGKTIVIPALPLDSDPAVLATVRGHIDLQSAHIRYSDRRAVAKAGMDDLQAWCWRIIEDWRVGQKMARAYPGSRVNLNWLITNQDESLGDGWEAQSPGPAMAALLYMRAAVLAWDVPEVLARSASHAEILRRAFPALVPALDRLLANVRAHCPDTQSAIDHAALLAACLRSCGLSGDGMQEAGIEVDFPEERALGGQDMAAPGQQAGMAEAPDDARPDDMCPEDVNEDADGAMDEEGRPGEGFGAEDGLQGGMPGQQAEDEGLPDEDGLQDGTAEEQAGTCGSSSRGAGDAPFGEQLRQAMEQAPQSLGEALAEQLDAASTWNRRADFFQSPEEGMRTVKPLGNERRNHALRATVALKVRLQGLLQADTLRRSALGRRGRLHTRSLYRVAVGNPRLFLRDSDKRDTDTAVHILLDASGSMNGERIALAGDACYAVARALESIRGVSVGISVFPTDVFRGVFPLVRHDERVPDTFDIEGDGGTPLTEALWWALQQLAPRKEPRKLLLVLSDGQPDDRGSATEAFAVLKAAGIECFGIGIMDTSIGLLLPYSHCIINNLNVLAPTMFSMLQNAMRRGL